MSLKHGFIVFFLMLVIIAFMLLLWLATPHSWPIVAGTLKAQYVVVDSEPFLMVTGDPMNKLGQIQSINIDVDEDKMRFVVSRCIVRWNPFFDGTVNNQWPIFYPLTSLRPGKYEVIYYTSNSNELAGVINVPASPRSATEK